MDSGRTLVRIFRDRNGKVAYQIMLEGDKLGLDLLGALHSAADEISMEIRKFAKEMDSKDTKKVRKLMGDDPSAPFTGF